MSSQLANMQLEQQALQQEVTHIQNAAGLPESARQLLQHMLTKESEDPLINYNLPDNEWTYNKDGQGCCSIM